MYMYLFVIHSLWQDFFAYLCTYASCILAAYWIILELMLTQSHYIINLYEEYGIWYEGKGLFTNLELESMNRHQSWRPDIQYTRTTRPISLVHGIEHSKVSLKRFANFWLLSYTGQTVEQLKSRGISLWPSFFNPKEIWKGFHSNTPEPLDNLETVFQ